MLQFVVLITRPRMGLSTYCINFMKKFNNKNNDGKLVDADITETHVLTEGEERIYYSTEKTIVKQGGTISTHQLIGIISFSK